MNDEALINISLGIISGIITTVLLNVGKYAISRYNYYQKHSFLYESFKNYQVIQIIMPSIYIDSFGFDSRKAHMSHNSPPNVLFMPFNESSAIYELVVTINRIFTKKDVRLITPAQYNDLHPAISIGGPSVNSFAERSLAKQFPQFNINYPEATAAKIKGLTFTTEQDSLTGIVTKDYGFLFSIVGKSKVPCFIACGILAFGTQVAVKKLIQIRSKSEMGKSLTTKQTSIICVEAEIEEFAGKIGNSITVF